MNTTRPGFVLLGLIVAGLLPDPLPALDLKLATIAPEGSSWMNELRSAGQEIQKRTAGRVNLKFYGGGIQGNDRKVLRKIRIGQLQGGVFTANGLQERYPDILIYGLPMLFESQTEVDFLRPKIDARLTAGLEQAGFESYGFAGGGFAYFMTDKPVNGLDDLRGRKIWVPEGDEPSMAAMQALRLSPVILPITDVLTGLQTGLLDIVAAPPVGAVVLQWYTRVKYVTTQPLSYTIGTLVIDRNALKNVSAEDQAEMRTVLTELYLRLDAQNRVDNTRAEEALRANGLSFVSPNAAEVPQWQTAVSTAMNALAARGVFSASLLAEVRQLLQEYRSSGAPAAGQAALP